jgi:hypothetical protein
MNCKQCQQRILDALAAGASHLTPEVTAHRNSCSACAEFFMRQQHLFQSIDAGLQFIVNQPVPPSLLPSIRVRAHEDPGLQRASFPSWSLAAIVAAIILALTVSYSIRHPRRALDSSQIASSSPPQTAAPPLVRDAATIRSQPDAVRVLKASTPKRHVPALSSAGTQEVIVLAEERQAFVRFAAEVPQQPQVAVAFARPTPQDAPIEIALLHIDRLELNLLNPVASQ